MTKTLLAILLCGAATCAVAAPANDQPWHARPHASRTQDRARTQAKPVNRAARVEQRQAVQNRIETRREERRSRPALRPAPVRPNVRPSPSRPPLISKLPRPATQPPLPATTRPTPKPNWNESWRHNHKYDWNHWRKIHRTLFHLAFYIDPFGWNYQRYDIGWRLWPRFYGSRYWIMNPWEYRLPPPPPGCRWIRYYNDAILVDMWNGEVVDVIYDFFW